MFNLFFRLYQRSPMRVRKVITYFMVIPRILATLMSKPKVSVGANELHVDYSDNGSFRYQRCNRQPSTSYEPYLMQAFLELISANRNCIIIDAGASYGTYTLAAANVGQYGLVKRIFSFEPDYRCYGALKKSIKANRFERIVSVNQMIAGDTTGESKLLLSERASTSNRTYQSTTNTLSFSNEFIVPCNRIDNIVKKEIVANGLPVIAKIDVEGNELRVLHGMSETIESSSGFSIHLEYMPLAIREVGLKTDDVQNFLKQLRPDFAFIETTDGLKQFNEIDDLWQHMRSIENKSDHRYGGFGCNYIIGRGVDITPLTYGTYEPASCHTSTNKNTAA